MMENQFIKVAKTNNGDIAVDGRELHEFLEIGTRYDQWITRMIEYGFEENTDYLVMVKNNPNLQGGKQIIVNHILKLDMAKEISMFQRSEIGRQTRKYFIEVEKKYREQQQLQIPTKYKENLLRLVGDKVRLEAEKKELAHVIKVQSPKVEMYDSILNAKGLITVKQIAIDYGLTAQELNHILKEDKIHYKQSGQWQLYAKYKSEGFVQSITKKNNGRVYTHTRWTQKGRFFINNILKRHGIYSVTAKQNQAG